MAVYKWRQAVDGGGFQNAFAIANNTIHSSYQNVAIAGADVAGLHRTTSRNTGVAWQTSYRAFYNENQNAVVAIEFARRPSGDGKVFILTGRGGVDGLLMSNDAGQTWKKGGISIGGDGSTRGMNHSREIGRMICSDNNGSHLWVAGRHNYGGTNKWGIAHSGNDGESFTGGTGFAMGTGMIPTDSTIRFIVQHPTSDGTLFVGVDGKRTTSDSWTKADNAGGLYKITNAKSNSQSASTVTKLIGPGTSAQTTKNWVRDGVIIREGGVPFLYFIAGNRNGAGKEDATYSGVTVFKLNLNTNLLQDLSIGSKGLDDDQQWTTIDGYRNSGDSATTLWMGGWQGKTHENTGVVVSRNGGSTWNNLIGTNYPSISKNFPGGREWWMFDAHDSFKFNKSNYDCAHIRVDPNNTNRVFSAGRGGIWMTTDDGATWRPAMESLGVSMAQASAYNPANKNQMVEGNVDWASITSLDRFRYTTMPKGKNPPGDGGAANTVYAFHWTSRALAFATGGRGSSGDDSNGIVATSTNPFASGSFTDGMTNQNWQTGVGKTSRPRVVGIMDGVDGSGRHTLIAIAQKSKTTEDSGSTGIWKKVITTEPATGNWVRASSAAFSDLMVKNSMNVTSYWPQGSSTLYTFDRKECKLWRSNDYGTSWTSVWQYSGTKGKAWTGFVAGASASTVYVSVNAHVYKFTNANTGSSITPTAVTPSAMTAPGAIAVDDDGWVYVTQRFASGVPTSLWRSQYAGSNWEKISTLEYEEKVAYPHNMTVMTEGSKKTIMIDTWGNGTFIGETIVGPDPTFDFEEDFENEGSPLADGAAITTTNSNFGSLTGTSTFSADSKEGDRSGSFSVGTTAGVIFGDSKALEATPQYAVDFYFKITAMPAATTRIVALLNGAGTAFTGAQLTNTGKLVLQDGTTGVYTTAATLALNQWYRIAIKWDAVANTSQIRLWTGSNLLSATPSEDSFAKAYTNDTNVEKLRIGLLNSALTNTTVLIDDIMTKDDGTWPDRGFVNPTYSIILGYMPMGIQ